VLARRFADLYDDVRVSGWESKTEARRGG
jgi:hypothetical protein